MTQYIMSGYQLFEKQYVQMLDPANTSVKYG